MKRCSLLLLCVLSASTYANYKTLSPNYRDYFTVNFSNMTPAASLLTVEGSVTLENLNCNSTQCTFDLYGGSSEEDTGVATLLLGNPSNGFCTIVIPDGSKVTDVTMYPACVNAKSSPLQQRAHSHEYSFTITGNNPGPNPEPKYKVGDLAEGGVVIDVDSTGEHGLVAAKTDVNFPENGRGYDYYGTQPQAISHCAQTESGFSNWHLPSIEELGEINLNRKMIPLLENPGAYGARYWSSTTYCIDCGYSNSELVFSMLFGSSDDGLRIAMDPKTHCTSGTNGCSTPSVQRVYARCVRSF